MLQREAPAVGVEELIINTYIKGAQMRFSRPVVDVIQKRFSCRSYLETPIQAETQQRLAEVMAEVQTGPLGSRCRFELIAASDRDGDTLRGLGTYGFIHSPAGFIMGAVRDSATMFEDFGYRMEEMVLAATDLDLGTCWLGGTFTKSSFADRIRRQEDEKVPAVASVGYISATPRLLDRIIRRRARPNSRLPWEHLFFDQRFGNPVSQSAADSYAVPLEMVRQGPSASNRQPWRIVNAGSAWHFYVQRTPGYPFWAASPFIAGDLQRMDVGIAMCHFELTADGLGLQGTWAVDEPGIQKPDALTEYVASWVAS
jgi:hypothetical protein